MEHHCLLRGLPFLQMEVFSLVFLTIMVCIAVDKETFYFYYKRVMKHPIPLSQVNKPPHL